MIIQILQLCACIALVAAAIYWRLKNPPGEGAHKFLFPFIISAGVMGCVLVGPYGMEAFVAYYSGALYEVHPVAFRLEGPYRWVYLTAFILPLLPVFGLLRPIGKRPVLMTVLALLATVPVVYVRVMFA